MPRTKKQRRRKSDRRGTLTAAQWALRSRGLPIDGTAYVLAAASKSPPPPAPPALESTTACSSTMSSPAATDVPPLPEIQRLVRVERKRAS